MIFGLLAETTIPKVTNGKENTVLKRQNNAMWKLAPPAREQGVTVQTGGTGGGGSDYDVLGTASRIYF